MKLNAFVLFVSDITRSKKFYTDVIGLDIIYDFGNNITLSQNIALWKASEQHPIQQKLDTKTNVNKVELYFEEDKIEDCYQNLVSAEVEIFQHLHEEPWGQRTFRFFDPDHHLIEVGEPLTVFVRNMDNKGMNHQQIHEKTGIPMKDITEILNKKNQ
nr:VOC family protein [uncultured Carboxylicivirga sp.]